MYVAHYLYEEQVRFETITTHFMKKVYAFFKFFALLTFISITTQYNATAQCNVVYQGQASDPSCLGYLSVSGGAGAYWTLSLQSGVLYSFYWTAPIPACSDNTGFCVDASGTLTNTIGSPYVMQAGSTASINIGFYEANTNWCGNSATLSYIQTPASVTAGPTTSATVCASTGSYTVPAGYQYSVGGFANYGTLSWASSGDGSFQGTSGSTTTPTYIFGANDIANGGLITLTMTNDNGGCTASTTFSLTIDQSPTAASVGPNQSICNSLTSGSLLGNSPSVGTGAWTQTLGPGTSSFNPNNLSNSASATATQYGTYHYTWSISNGVCPASTATETVVYSPTPSTATVSSPTLNSCGSLTSGSLGGNTPVTGTGTWTQISGPGTTTFSNANSGSSTATATVTGTYKYQWTITSGSCPSSSATVTVNFYPTPTTATVTPTTQNICGSLTSAALGGNTPVVGTGQWSETSGPSSIFFSGGGTSGNATAGAGTYGTYILTWTITSGTCTSSANDTVNYYATPTTATVGSTQNLCGTLTTNLTGNVPAAGNGLWTQTAGPGTTTFGDSSVATTSATVSVPGSYTYTWTISNGTCAPSSASLVVNFVSTPTGGTIANTSYCSSVGSGTVTVSGVSNANEYQWSLPAGLSGSSGTATITVGGSLPGSYTVTVTPIDTAFGVTCTGSPITGVVNILGLPVIDSVNTHSITCFGAADDTIWVYATSSNGPLSYSIDGGTTYSNTTGIFTGISAGTYNVYVKDDSSCSVGYALNPVRITQTAVALSATSIVTPVGCTGDSNGAINLLASGGAGGYLYNWSSGQNIEIISGLPAGIYTGTVTDANGCQASVSDTLINPTPVVTTITKTNVTCYGYGNGTAQLSISGGVAPYQILWSNFDTTADITHLIAGLYRVRVIDAYGCEHSDSIRIKRPPLLTGTISVTNVACFGTNIDTIIANITGGNGGNTYTWSPSVSTDSIVTGVAPGQYFVTVTDINGCHFEDSATITQPLTALYDTSIIISQVGCAGASNGTIDVLANGGSGGYTYNWSSGQTIQYISGLSAGSYTCTVTDANGCTAATTEVLANPAALTSGITATNPLCYGAANGTLSLTVNGGVAPYTLLWSNDDSSLTIGGISAGQYGVVITDSFGCKQIDTITVTQPTSLSATVVVTNIGCSGSNTGSVVVTVTGGTPGYTYSWSSTGSTVDSVSGVGAGTYTVTITDANGCSITASGTVLQTGSPLIISAVVTDVKCNNDSNGAIDLNVSGGSGGYTYTWATGQTTPFINGLPAGTYSVTVSSSGGCTGTLSETLANPTPIVSSITGTNLTCYGAGNGSASLTITGGGVPPYNILWNNFDTSYSISGLDAGQYGVIITDSNGCRQIDTITLTQPSALSASVVVTNVSCYGGNNGSVVVTVAGGTPSIGGYTYSWSSTGSTVDSVSGVGPGTYTVTATDANGCTVTASGTVTQPAALNAFVSVTNIACNGGGTGSVVVTVTGGTPGYTYSWSSTGSTVDSVSGVGPGTYTVTATDANGCTITASGTVNQPLSGITVNQQITTVKCNNDSNGAIALTVYGGVGGYTYDWSTGQTTPSISGLPGGIYDVSVTDANGCFVAIADTLVNPAAISDNITSTNVQPCYGAHNGTATLTASGGTGALTLLWSTGDTSFAITNLVGDKTYDVTITDANGCTFVDSVRITRPTKLRDTITVSNILCNGTNTDTLSVSASGSYQSGGYTYTWSPNVGSGALITGVPAGTYYLTVTDTAGCKSVDSAVITQPLNPLTITDVVTQITCNNANNGSITVTAAGGTPGYTYNWLGGQTTTTISNLAGGPYTVTVTDTNGCTASLTENIVNPPAISANIVGTNTTCNGGNNGTATLNVSGGTPGYTYLWSNFDTAQNLSNLTAGLYKVIITDANGCKGYDTILITQPTPIVAVVTVTNSGCTGGNTGSVVVSVSGGTPGYTYSWSSTGSTVDSVSGVGPGTYTVTITDANGCSLIDSGTVIQPPSTLSAISIVTNITCNNSNNGEITVLPSGGSGGYTYSWTGTAQTTSTITGLGAGIYTVTVTDGNGCSTSLSDTLTNPTAITSTITGTNVTCAGANNGSASITSVTGGTLPYTFLWSNFDNTQSVDSLSGGWYFVIISDANGCQNRDSIRITDPQPLVVTDSVSPVVCNNGTNGAIILTVTGGTGADTYTWTPAGPNSPDNTGLAAGTYSVTVSDANGCSTSLTETLINPLTLTIANTVTDPRCNGDQNGSIDLIVVGGTPQYTYVWSPNVGNTANVNFLGAGTYFTTVTDAHGCQITDSVVVNQPAPMYVSGIQKNISCYNLNDGYIFPTPYGGTQPYSFQWYLGSSTSAPLGPVTENIINLAGGPYYLIVTDANGCTVPFTRTIINPDSLWVQLVASNVTCYGASTGSVAVVDSGGTHPYQYLWNNFTTDSFQTGVSAGTYTVVVTDSNGCHKNQSIAVTQPQPISVLAVSNNILCYGGNTGSIALTVNGGVPQYTYNWSTTPAQTSGTASTLTAGSYTVTVTDANTCSVAVSYTLTQPDSIAINTAVTDPTCSGGDNGFISLDARGGVAPFTYSWSTTPAQTGNVASGLGAGTYYATVTDNNGCTVLDSGVVVSPLPIVVTVDSGSNACAGGGKGGIVVVTATGGLSPYTYGIGDIIQGTDTFTGLSVGSYTAVATDANGCIGTAPVNVAPLGTFTDTLSANPIIVLAGETVTLYAHATTDSGASITSYLWAPSDSLTFPCGTPNCDSAQGMPTHTQYYYVQVTNSRGCSIIDTILVKVSNTASAFVPSAFTPNNDGLNDFFTMDILGATTIDVQIWNRWGEKVFSNPNQANGINASGAWDGTFRGKSVEYDTYTYQLVVTYFDGHTETVAGTVVVMK